MNTLAQEIAEPGRAAAPVRIVDCDDRWENEWDAFVARSPQASFYHRYAWRRINARLHDHRTFALGAVAGGRLVGLLPIVQLNTWLFGNIGCSMPFVNFGGPCADTPAIEAALLAEAAALVERERMAYLELRSIRNLGDEMPVNLNKVSMTVRLDPNPDTLWNGFKTQHRQQIRRAYKEGFTGRHGRADLLDAFYDVVAESWRDLGTPFYRRRYFESIVDTFGDAIQISVVYAGREVAAAQMCAYHGGVAEGMWLGMRAKYRRQMAGYVLYWELLKHACEHGIGRFHLGRSTADSGAEAFKKKWNATATQLYWHYILGTRREMPGLNVANAKYRRAIETWQRLPLAVTRAIGPSIARGIP
jgi:FemAB-related protein (PEP-CTERM system-associated)